jgi:hypothetical protein
MKKMFDTLVSLYQSQNINKKRILRNKLRSMVMNISNTITNYLMKITQIHDQLATIGEQVEDVELVNMALNGFSASWEPFIKVISARENLTNFERIWDDNIQDET